MKIKKTYTIACPYNSAEKAHIWGNYARKLVKGTWIVQGRNEE
jgi:hypothetical protein